MMTHSERFHTLPTTRALRTVAVVTSDPHEPVLNAVMGAVDHDVVFVESTARAYSQIKRVMPDLVVMCLSGDDVNGCQVLSMLALDNATSRIPVLTCMTSAINTAPPDADGAVAESFSEFVSMSLH